MDLGCFPSFKVREHGDRVIDTKMAGKFITALRKITNFVRRPGSMYYEMLFMTPSKLELKKQGNRARSPNPPIFKCV